MRELIIAAGDSWFDYARWACDPSGKTDLLQEIKASGFDVVREAIQGTRIQDFADRRTQLDRLCARIAEHVGNGRSPKAILLSGGGNDIVEKNVFIQLLNEANGEERCLNEEHLATLIDGGIRDAYIRCISEINRFCIGLPGLQRLIPVLVHGYDNPIPDGRSHGLPFKTPWLGPAFQKRGYADLRVRTENAAHLLDRLNMMIAGLSELQEIPNVIYVKLQGTLCNDLHKYAYRLHWENELHPTKLGWSLLATKYIAALNRLESPQPA